MTTHVMVICILRETWPIVHEPITCDVRTALSLLSRALSDSEPRCSRRVVLENLSPIPAPFSIEIDGRGAVQKLIDIAGHRRYFSRSILGRRAEHRPAEVGTPCVYLKPNLIPPRDRVHGLDTQTESTVHLVWRTTIPLVLTQVSQGDTILLSGRSHLQLSSALRERELHWTARMPLEEGLCTSIDRGTLTETRCEDRP